MLLLVSNCKVTQKWTTCPHPGADFMFYSGFCAFDIVKCIIKPNQLYSFDEIFALFMFTVVFFLVCNFANLLSGSKIGQNL